MKTSFTRPIPRVPSAETEAGGLGMQRPIRPQLSARWVVGDDGKLTCRWDLR
jgi:hypothetical protein